MKHESRKKAIWTITRTLLFVIIGLFNTLFAKPEDIGSYKNYLGILFLLLAAADIVVLIVKYKKGYLHLHKPDGE